MEIHQLLIGSMRNFVYLLISENEGFVIDPQRDLEPWASILERKQVRLKGVLLTHTHHDHIGGAPEAASRFLCPIYVHQADAFRLKSWPAETKERLQFLTEGLELNFGADKILVWHTPGHSAGECCFLIKNSEPAALFTGDTVFVGMVGRTDLETGSTAELFRTLQRISTLPEDTVIYPGHHYGQTPTSTLAREKRESAAFQCKTAEELELVP